MRWLLRTSVITDPMMTVKTSMAINNSVSEKPFSFFRGRSFRSVAVGTGCRPKARPAFSPAPATDFLASFFLWFDFITESPCFIAESDGDSAQQHKRY